MNENLCPMDELVTVDLEGFLDALDDPSGETECFTPDGKKVD